MLPRYSIRTPLSPLPVAPALLSDRLPIPRPLPASVTLLHNAQELQKAAIAQKRTQMEIAIQDIDREVRRHWLFWFWHLKPAAQRPALAERRTNGSCCVRLVDWGLIEIFAMMLSVRMCRLTKSALMTRSAGDEAGGGNPHIFGEVPNVTSTATQ